MESSEELAAVLYYEIEEHGMDAPGLEQLVSMMTDGNYVPVAEVIGGMTQARSLLLPRHIFARSEALPRPWTQGKRTKCSTLPPDV